jgi:hypothetical protein
VNIEPRAGRVRACMQSVVAVLGGFVLLAVPPAAFAELRISPGVFGGMSAVTGSGVNPRIGGSVDVIMATGFGVGAEAGWVGDDYGIGLVSVSGSYRLREE